jgi:VWFA-related protein
VNVRRLHRITLAWIFIVFASATTARTAPEPEFSLKKTVEEVRLSLVATDKNHQYVKDLSPTELAVVDNEVVVRSFRSFGRAQQGRLRLVILLDTSESAAPSLRAQFESVSRFVHDSRWQADDSVTMIAFDAKADVLCDGDCATASIASKFSSMHASGLTAIYDAVVKGAGILAADADPDTRSAIILFSDGRDTFSNRGTSEAIAAAHRVEAPIYTVDITTKRFDEEGAQTLKRLAVSTGGLELSIADGAPKILTDVLGDLRSRFVLTYVPPSRTEGEHIVRILPTRNQGLKFRSRGSYVYRAGTDNPRGF